MIKLNGMEIKPTIFPDGTSQVWKVGIFDVQRPKNYEFNIEWDFENEAEIFHILQLHNLINSVSARGVNLIIKYLPYGRQDKFVSNETTFALNTFKRILSSFHFNKIEVLDAHNPKSLPESWINLIPNERIKEVTNESKSTIICFPDYGASQRGYSTSNLPLFTLDKKRDQTTGEIIGLKCDLPLDLTGHKVLILDDICDGGRTFIEAKKVLDCMGADEVNLYTTHGIYSKGVEVLKESGIKRIFNYKGEV